MVVYLGFFLVFSSVWLKDPTRLWKGLLIVTLYALFDLVWTKVRDRLFYLPLSSFISGFILALVANPAPPLLFIALLPLIAVLSKQLLHFLKPRHLFNPAAFAMGAVSFFTPMISWWGVSWGEIPLWIIGVVGLFILWRIERFSVALPFLISYGIFLSLLFLKNGTPVAQLFPLLKPQLFDPTTLFFATVMLVEPVTSNFPKKRKIFYGAMVGFLAVLISFLSSFLPLGDPLIYGLLLGNLIAGFLFLPWKR